MQEWTSPRQETDVWNEWKMTFFASGKMEFLVRGTVFGGGKKN